MIGMQDQDLVHRLLDNRIEDVLFGRDSKQHLQEISGIGEIVARIGGGLFNGVLVAHGGDSGHFRQQPRGGQRPVLRIFHVQNIMIERRQRPHQSTHQRHRVRIAAKAAAHAGYLLVHQGMAGDGLAKRLIAGLIRRVAPQHDVRHLEKITLASQLIHWIAAVQQHAVFRIDPRDRRLASGGVGEAGVVAAESGVIQLAYVDSHMAPGSRHLRQGDGRRLPGNRKR